MPSYKLMYFNVPARGEVARILFTLAGVPFEDKRISFEEWATMKKDFPFGLPALEIDGKGFFYGQSNAINRYIAKKYGFYGKTELDQLRIDMIIYDIDDLITALTNSAYAKEEEKAALRKKWFDEQSVPMLQKLEAILKENKGGDGWLVGDGITLADLHFMNWADFPEFRYNEKLDLSKYPKLKALKQRVRSHPKVAEWFSKSPKIVNPFRKS